MKELPICIVEHGPELKLRITGGWGNGYVAVPKGHPAFGEDYELLNVDVHGGLTFGACLDDCGDDFFPEILDRANWYAFGFDTLHYRDNESHNEAYVLAETLNLAAQLQAMVAE